MIEEPSASERLLWAKVGEGRYADAHHPLIHHLIDTGVVAQLMWDRFLSPWSQSRLSSALGLNSSAARSWIGFLAALHDIGKASPGFQALVPDCIPILQAAGFSFSLRFSPPPHGTVSAALLPGVLQRLGLSRRSALTAAAVIGGHHGVIPTAADVDDVGPVAKGSGEWEAARASIIGELIHTFDVPGSAPQAIDLPAAAVVAGLISVADWIASDPANFAYAFPSFKDMGLDEYLDHARRAALGVGTQMGWTWTGPPRPAAFADLFGFSPRPVQQFAEELGGRLDLPCLVLIEAPTGEGKTEAALHLTDTWSSKIGRAGAYLALPSQATSNQMFGRVRTFLARRYPKDPVNLQLQHGHASLSADFAQLQREGRDLFAPVDVFDDRERSGVGAASWFVNRKRGLLAPFGVGTVDQALLATLHTRHVFVRLLGLSGRPVVIDEVHAYDTYMSTLLDRLLEWLAVLGSPVALLSATLPAGRHTQLNAAYARGLGSTGPGPSPARFPRVSWTAPSGTGTGHVEVSAAQRRQVDLRFLDSGFDLVGELSAALADGGNAAIVTNTVARAQAVYELLRAGFSANRFTAELGLLHARYTAAERQRREGRVLARYGPDAGPERPARSVLVSTQIIEQSLDLDFDLLVTEHAPADLLLQRAGRLHRHSRVRPRGLASPQMWVVRPEASGDQLDFGASRYVYAEHILLRSWLAVSAHTALHLPDMVQELVEAVYGEGVCPFAPGSPGAIQWQRSLESLQHELQSQQLEARIRCIPHPTQGEQVSELTRLHLEEDSPELHRELQALTRLTGPSVQVIAMGGTEEAPTLQAPSRNPVDLTVPPDHRLTRELLLNSIGVSSPGAARALLDIPVPAAWDRNALLRGSRPLVLSSEVTVGRYRLRLDDELGLVIGRA